MAPEVVRISDLSTLPRNFPSELFLVAVSRSDHAIGTKMGTEFDDPVSPIKHGKSPVNGEQKTVLLIVAAVQNFVQSFTESTHWQLGMTESRASVWSGSWRSVISACGEVV